MYGREKRLSQVACLAAGTRTGEVIYLGSENFPKAEEFRLESQMRRAAVSVVLNIVEGYRRASTKDYLHFLNIAQGSLSELEASLELCLDVGYLSDELYTTLEHKRSEVSFLLHKLVTAIKVK